MNLKVGVIGVGVIGKDHVRRLNDVIHNTTLVAISDVDKDRTKEIAAQYNIKSYSNAEDLIKDSDIDAVVIASIDSTHCDYVKLCLQEKKYVLCEKPLAKTASECLEIIDLETKLGKRLVQVGFMRRYDKGYIEMKQALEKNLIGEPLIIHAAHRNLTQPSYFETDMAINGVCIHEIDICRWLLNEDYKRAQVLKVKQNTKTAGNFLDPQIVLLETISGVRIDVEINDCSGYGYDIQCEVVGENGVLRLPDPLSIEIRHQAMKQKNLHTDWTQRFISAYDLEFSLWATAVQNNKLSGPSSWDGYVACVTADAIIKSRTSQNFENITLRNKPAMYL